MQSKVLNLKGNEVKEILLNEKIFNVDFSLTLFKELIEFHQSNARSGTAKVLTRSELNWSTKKVRKQKGSGKSRAGGRGMPHWRGGYTVFGPNGRDYSYTIPKSKKRKALAMCLTKKLQDNELIIVQDLVLENAKTKDFLTVCKNLNLNKKALFVDVEKAENIYLSMRNVIGFDFLSLMGLNVLSLSKTRQLVITESAIKSLEEKYESL